LIGAEAVKAARSHLKLTVTFTFCDKAYTCGYFFNLIFNSTSRVPMSSNFATLVVSVEPVKLTSEVFVTNSIDLSPQKLRPPPYF